MFYNEYIKPSPTAYKFSRIVSLVFLILLNVSFGYLSNEKNFNDIDQFINVSSEINVFEVNKYFMLVVIMIFGLNMLLATTEKSKYKSIISSYPREVTVYLYNIFGILYLFIIAFTLIKYYLMPDTYFLNNNIATIYISGTLLLSLILSIDVTRAVENIKEGLVLLVLLLAIYFLSLHFRIPSLGLFIFTSVIYTAKEIGIRKGENKK